MDNQNIQNLSGSTTVWVGNNPYLVNSAGVIPLTSGFSALSLNQSPTQPDVSNQGQFYVVSVQESPTKTSPQGLSNPRTGLGLYDSSALTASSPNLGSTSNNNFQPQFQLQPQPINFQYNPGLNQFPPTFTNVQSQQFPSTFTNGQNPLTFTNVQSQQFPSTFTNGQNPLTFTNVQSQQFPPTFTNVHNPLTFTNGQNKQFPPTFTNGLNQNFPATFTNGYSTLPNPQKPLTINPGSTTNNLNGNFQASPAENSTSSQNFSESGTTESVPLASPSLSTSSTSILSESSYGGFPSPDAGVNCVYKSDPQSPSRTPSALTGPATLPKPKCPSLTGGKDVNDNEAPKQIYPTVPPCYERPGNKEYCLRCGKRVYHMEKLGPVKECLYHKLCFRCVVCNTTLNVKNYHVNPNDMEDLNVYCVTHVPSNKSVSVDAGAVGIKGALGAPKLGIINQQIRGRSDAQYGNEGFQTGVNPQRKLSQGKYKGHTYNLQLESHYQQNVPTPNLHTTEYDYNATRLYNSP